MNQCSGTGIAFGFDQFLLEMEHPAAVQHVEVPKQVRPRILLIRTRRDQVQLHPGEEQRIADPHDRRQHVHEAEDHREPPCDFGFHRPLPFKQATYRE